jgi:hypothetical protein
MSGSGAANEAPGAEAPLGADQLLGLVYEELRKLAALVHEGIAGAAGRLWPRVLSSAGQGFAPIVDARQRAASFKE